MKRVSHLNALQALESAVRNGSFTEAASELGITPAAVGQRIKSLEDYLDTELVLRGRDGIKPKEALEKALPHLLSGFDNLAKTAKLLNMEGKNTISVYADNTWISMWLKPRLKRFKSIHPQIEVLTISNKSKVSRPVDCKIAFAPANNNSIELFPEYLLPLARPDNCERLVSVRSNRKLEGFPLLHLDVYAKDPKALNWAAWASKYGQRKTRATQGTQFVDTSRAIKSACKGSGFVLGGLSYSLRLIETNKLKPPFEVIQGAWTSHAYRLENEDSRPTRSQVKTFRDWLTCESKQTYQNMVKFIDKHKKHP